MPVYWVPTPLCLARAQISQEEFICVLLKFPVFYSICWYVISLYNISCYYLCLCNKYSIISYRILLYIWRKNTNLLFQWVFLPDASLRKQLALPPPVPVDYRAACFCHRQLIDQGYVCSVCLSSELKITKQVPWTVCSKSYEMNIRWLIHSILYFFIIVFCKFSPICTTCQWVQYMF